MTTVIVYFAAMPVLGVLLVLAFHIVYAAIVSLPQLAGYLLKHWSAVLFSTGSRFLNRTYKKVPLAITPYGDAAHAPAALAILIPGTWSPQKYDW
jgi:hypothetical protein